MKKEKVLRVHAEVIKAWADGEEIQTRWGDSEWVTVANPLFHVECEYRVNPATSTSTSFVMFLSLDTICAACGERYGDHWGIKCP